jgi:hypothetical protein
MSIEQVHAVFNSRDRESGFHTRRFHTWKGNEFELILFFDEDGAPEKGYERFHDAAGNERVQSGPHCDASIFDKCRQMLGL